MSFLSRARRGVPALLAALALGVAACGEDEAEREVEQGVEQGVNEAEDAGQEAEQELEK